MKKIFASILAMGLLQVSMYPLHAQQHGGDSDRDGLLDTLECPAAGRTTQKNNGKRVGGTSANVNIAVSGAPAWNALNTLSPIVAEGINYPNIQPAYSFNHHPYPYPTDPNAAITITFDTPILAKEFAFLIQGVSGYRHNAGYIVTVNDGSPEGVIQKSTVDGVTNMRYDSVSGEARRYDASVSSHRQSLLLKGIGNRPIHKVKIAIGVFDGGVRRDDAISYTIFGKKECRDTDGDGTPDYQDLDSDNDSCPDNKEGPDGFRVAKKIEIHNHPQNQVVNVGGGVSFTVSATAIETETYAGGQPDRSAGTGADVSHQRQLLSGSERIDIPNQTGSILNIPSTTPEMANMQVRAALYCVGLSCATYSDLATLNLIFTGTGSATATGSFIKNDCKKGSNGSEEIFVYSTGAVATGSTQEIANTNAHTQAQYNATQYLMTDMGENDGQEYANEHGKCTKIPQPTIIELPHTGA